MCEYYIAGSYRMLLYSSEDVSVCHYLVDTYTQAARARRLQPRTTGSQNCNTPERQRHMFTGSSGESSDARGSESTRTALPTPSKLHQARR